MTADNDGSAGSEGPRPERPPLTPEQREMLRPLVEALARMQARLDHAREQEERLSRRPLA